MNYQYRTEQVRGDASGVLNTLGGQGWELIQVVQRGATAQLYLKRGTPLIETFKKVPVVNIGDAKPRGRPKRPPTEYQVFLGEQMTLGKTMKEVAQAWRELKEKAKA